MTTMLKAGAAALAAAVVLASAVTAAPPPGVAKDDIDKAVERGVQALRKSQTDKGSWTGTQEGGLTCLTALTLLECGVPMDDPAIKKAAHFIRENAVNENQTYSLALSILFLDRLGEPVDIALIDSLTVRLLGGQLRGGNWTYNCANPSRPEMDRLTKLVKDAPDPRERRTQPKE